jgi:hypothetical protein
MLRAEIGDHELCAIGRQGQSAQCGARQRAARRKKLQDDSFLLQVENIDVIDVGEAEPLALLIIEHKSVEGGFRKGLHVLERVVL